MHTKPLAITANGKPWIIFDSHIGGLNGHWHRSFLQIMWKVSDQQNRHTEPQGFLHSLPIPDKLWQLVGMDFKGPLSWSQDNDYLLVIIDQLILQVHLVPTMTQVTAKEVAWLFLKEVVRLHQVPESIVSDHNTKFMSTFWCELHRLMGTKLLMSTAFHPQTDGATERVNCSIGQILRMIKRIGQTNAQRGSKWIEWIEPAMHSEQERGGYVEMQLSSFTGRQRVFEQDNQLIKYPQE